MKYDITIPDDIQDLFHQNHYAYIYSKAELYLRIGPDRYRKGDALGFPPLEWEEQEGEKIYDLLESGCRQVLDFNGLTPEKAFKGLGIMGFNRLIWLLHFFYRDAIGQLAT